MKDKDIKTKEKDLKGTAGSAWNNTSEVTGLIAGSNIAITDNGANIPIISNITTGSNMVFFTSTSATPWVLPSGVSQIKVTLIGAGGTGGSGSSSGSLGGGGGAGAMTIAVLSGLPAGATFKYTIAGGANITTTFTSTSGLTPALTLTATSGSTGGISNTIASGGAGGAKTPQPVSPYILSYFCMAGASGGYGFNIGTAGWAAGAGGNTMRSGGAPQVFGYNIPGTAAVTDNTGSGGGGGLGNGSAGGAGSAGIIIIEY